MQPPWILPAVLSRERLKIGKQNGAKDHRVINSASMIYLLLGDDKTAKDHRIAGIKAKYLTDASARQLDYEYLHGVKLDPDVLKKALISLPAVSKKRLLLIRAADKLDSHNKEMILEFIQSGHAHAVVVLDCEEGGGKSSFISQVKADAEVIHCGTPTRRQNVFDMTKALERRDPAQALKIFNELVTGGEPLLKILSGIVWYWGDRKDQLSGVQFTKGLKILQEADLNIKRTRLRPEHAVEVAVTKLERILNPK